MGRTTALLPPLLLLCGWWQQPPFTASFLIPAPSTGARSGAFQRPHYHSPLFAVADPLATTTLPRPKEPEVVSKKKQQAPQEKAKTAKGRPTVYQDLLGKRTYPIDIDIDIEIEIDIDIKIDVDIDMDIDIDIDV
jgi:hypothetical protein